MVTIKPAVNGFIVEKVIPARFPSENSKTEVFVFTTRDDLMEFLREWSKAWATA